MASVAPSSFMRRGGVTTFVEHHLVAWELAMAGLTVLYVGLAIADDELGGRVPGVFLVGLAGTLFLEFLVRCWDSPHRLAYLRHHWIDVVSCLPIIGGLRLLRLVRLVRLVAAFRTVSAMGLLTGRDKGRQALTFVGPVLLLVWASAAYAIWVLEHGINPNIRAFGDALYWSAITMTTIGYGDVAPMTGAGRVVAGLLAFVGIGLLGFASAQLTARFLNQSDRTAEELSQLRAELKEIHNLLESSSKAERER